MMTNRASRRSLLLMSLVVFLAACSGSDGSDGVGTEATTATGESAATTQAPTTPQGTEPGASTASTDAPAEDVPPVDQGVFEMREDLGIGLVVLESVTDAGSHPTLAWQQVQGASSYWLVVHDAEGRPYWAWTGSGTSVRIGGGDRSETNQTAAVHESLTWRVAAFDADGVLVALSETASLTP